MWLVMSIIDCLFTMLGGKIKYESQIVEMFDQEKVADNCTCAFMCYIKF